jgi:uncharacterized protein YjiS (DUF1127 family)
MAEIGSSIFGRGRRSLVAAVDAVLDLIENQRERAELMQMSDRELKDIGLTRSAIGGTDPRDFN